MLPNPRAVVFGVITIGALLAAESAQRETYLDTIGAVAVALLVYWLAHAYAEFTAHRLEHKQALTLSGFARTLARELMTIAGAALPLLALVLCWAAGARLTSAVNIALWTSAATILLVEVAAAVRAGLVGRALIAQTALGALLGVLVIVLKLLLH
jgi:membrane protein YqaA with SNARE-associated domain